MTTGGAKPTFYTILNVWHSGAALLVVVFTQNRYRKWGTKWSTSGSAS